MTDEAESLARSVPEENTDSGLPPGVAQGQLIIASNRQPYRHTREGDDVTIDRPTGGLTAGLDPIMQELGGTWVAWGDGDADRSAVDEAGRAAVPPEDPGYTIRRIWLNDDQVRGYYLGYSNRVLWPLCHATLTNVQCQPGYWAQYREVNEAFAEAVASEAGEAPVVWFHDYHLALAPRMTRSHLGDEARLAQFWHIPWPSWDTFRACPHGEAVIQGLLANDHLAFHVDRYRRNFLRCVEATLPEATVDWEQSRVDNGDGGTSVGAVPMGVPTDRIERLATASDSPLSAEAIGEATSIDAERRLIVGVDRLDYTKGLLNRLEALSTLWEERPRWRETVTYLQTASESRSAIPAYSDLQDSVERQVEQINDRFGTADWQPIVYTTDRLEQSTLYGLLREADVGLVTPLRDGMNLVAQEFIAAQVDDAGVLVLSDQTGAHDRMGDEVLTTNPYDAQSVARTITQALTLPSEDRRQRMARLRRIVAAHDLRTWAERTLEAVLDSERTLGEAEPA